MDHKTRVYSKYGAVAYQLVYALGGEGVADSDEDLAANEVESHVIKGGTVQVLVDQGVHSAETVNGRQALCGVLSLDPRDGDGQAALYTYLLVGVAGQGCDKPLLILALE
ncbi:hypothetical protein PG993_006844 [Apiospora rasikravindrae]|uniref:Uncharacterized protein n=1 Tax=Apiospora rasikravindrae TaxID=990691 RepID=A0ABR1SY06_9PEZI